MPDNITITTSPDRDSGQAFLASLGAELAFFDAATVLRSIKTDGAAAAYLHDPDDYLAMTDAIVRPVDDQGSRLDPDPATLDALAEVDFEVIQAPNADIEALLRDRWQAPGTGFWVATRTDILRYGRHLALAEKRAPGTLQLLKDNAPADGRKGALDQALKAGNKALAKHKAADLQSQTRGWVQFADGNSVKVAEILPPTQPGNPPLVQIHQLDAFERLHEGLGPEGSNPVTAWKKHPGRQIARTIANQPGLPLFDPSTQVLNLWPPTDRIDRSQAKDPAPILAFIRQVIASGDPDLADYILNLIAYRVQNPEGPVGVMLLLKGGMGVGKGLFLDILLSLFGDTAFVSSDGSQIVGRFNFDSVAGKNFIAIYETNFGYDAAGKKLQEALKSRITDETTTCEEKFGALRKLDNHAFIVASSNHANAWPITSDDRRVCVVEVQQRPKWTKARFDRIGALRRDPAVINGLHAYLMDRDLSAFDPREYPRTPAHAREVVYSLPPTMRHLARCMTEGRAPLPSGEVADRIAQAGSANAAFSADPSAGIGWDHARDWKVEDLIQSAREADRTRRNPPTMQDLLTDLDAIGIAATRVPLGNGGFEYRLSIPPLATVRRNAAAAWNTNPDGLIGRFG